MEKRCVLQGSGPSYIRGPAISRGHEVWQLFPFPWMLFPGSHPTPFHESPESPWPSNRFACQCLLSSGFQFPSRAKYNGHWFPSTLPRRVWYVRHHCIHFGILAVQTYTKYHRMAISLKTWSRHCARIHIVSTSRRRCSIEHIRGFRSVFFYIYPFRICVFSFLHLCWFCNLYVFLFFLRFDIFGVW